MDRFKQYDRQNIFLFVCTCIEFFTHINGEGSQVLTYARHLWPLSSEGSLACNTYFDTGHPLSPRTCDIHTCYRAFSSGAVTTLF